VDDQALVRMGLRTPLARLPVAGAALPVADEAPVPGESA